MRRHVRAIPVRRALERPGSGKVYAAWGAALERPRGARHCWCGPGELLCYARVCSLHVWVWWTFRVGIVVCVCVFI